MENMEEFIQALTARVRAGAERAAPRPTKPTKYIPTMNFNLWLQSFNAYCDAVEIEEADRKPHLIGLLDLQTAYAAVDKLDLPADMEYDAFIARLTDRFTMHRTVQDFRLELSNRDQLEKEAIESYGDELLELVRNAFPNADADTRSELAKDRFLKGVRVTDAVRERLYLQQPADLIDAMRTVRQLEAAQKASAAQPRSRLRVGLNVMGAEAAGGSSVKDDELQQLRQQVKELQEKLQNLQPDPQQPKPRWQGTKQQESLHGARQPHASATTTQRQRSVTCYKCGEAGHFSFQCRKQGNASRGPPPGGK